MKKKTQYLKYLAINADADTRMNDTSGNSADIRSMYGLSLLLTNKQYHSAIGTKSI